MAAAEADSHDEFLCVCSRAEESSIRPPPPLLPPPPPLLPPSYSGSSALPWWGFEEGGGGAGLFSTSDLPTGSSHHLGWCRWLPPQCPALSEGPQASSQDEVHVEPPCAWALVLFLRSTPRFFSPSTVPMLAGAVFLGLPTWKPTTTSSVIGRGGHELRKRLKEKERKRDLLTTTADHHPGVCW